MIACITLGFCIAAASSGSFMILAIMSAGVTPSSCSFFLFFFGFSGFKKKEGKKGAKGKRVSFFFFSRAVKPPLFFPLLFFLPSFSISPLS